MYISEEERARQKKEKEVRDKLKDIPLSEFTVDDLTQLVMLTHHPVTNWDLACLEKLIERRENKVEQVVQKESATLTQWCP